MATTRRFVYQVAIACILGCLPVSPALATSWKKRLDIGVAAVDTRTGKVLWESWRLDEVPAGISKEERAAVEYLLAFATPDGPWPRVSLLPNVPIKDLEVKDAWPDRWGGEGAGASEGKRLIYYRQGTGVIALNRQTKKEAWRMLTTRRPYASEVVEAGENLAFIQIGSHVPATLHSAVICGGKSHLEIKRLEPHSVEQQVAAATLLQHYGDGYLRPELKTIIERFRKEKNDPAAESAGKAVEKLLTTWPKKRDGQRLLDGCVAALIGAKEDNPLREFAWPGKYRVMTWCLLQELIYGTPTDGYSRQGYNYAYHHGWDEQPVSLTDATRTKLADHCRHVMATGPSAEVPFAASVLLSTAVGWAKLTNDERKELFLSPEPSTWRWAAMSLAKNGRREQLMEWARLRPAVDHLDVLWVLKHKKSKEWAETELKFWLDCARHSPGGVASALRSSDEPAPTAFRKPILSYLQKEIEKPTVSDGGQQPAYDLFAAIYLLDGWKNPDDTPLLLEYLKHPVRSKETKFVGTEGEEYLRYGLREHVRSLLEKRGAKVPSGIVYEERAEKNK